MKVAVVTGAGSGLGSVTAEALSKAGWSVALMGRRPDPLETLAGTLDDAIAVSVDVTVPDAVDTAFAAVVEKWGRIDLLFNNAGRGSPGRPIDETPVEDWFGVLHANLTGSFLCARAAFAQMRRQDPQGGRIINNGSISAYAPRPGSVPYTTTKHGISGLTKTLSLDGRPFNIACGQIDIGNALTDMARPMLDGVPQADGSIREEAVMDPAHVAEAVVHMASLPLEANIPSLTIMATTMPFVGRG